MSHAGSKMRTRNNNIEFDGESSGRDNVNAENSGNQTEVLTESNNNESMKAAILELQNTQRQISETLQRLLGESRFEVRRESEQREATARTNSPVVNEPDNESNTPGITAESYGSMAERLMQILRGARPSNDYIVPKFTEGNDPLVFLDEISFYQKNMCISDACMLGRLGPMLQGHLQYWWIRIKRELQTMQDFKDRFLKMFLGTDYRLQLERKIMNVIQNEREPVPQFVLRVESLCRHLDADMPDTAIARKVLNGLNPNLKAVIRLPPDPTLTEVQEAAQEAQNLIQDIRRYNSGSNRQREAQVNPRGRNVNTPQNQPRDRNQIVCFNCHGRSHKAAFCREPIRQALINVESTGQSLNISGVNDRQEIRATTGVKEPETTGMSWEELCPLQEEEGTVIHTQPAHAHPLYPGGNSIATGWDNRPKIEAQIGEWRGQVLVDSGASGSLIAYSTWGIVKGSSLTLRGLPDKQLRSANGGIIHVIGEALVPIRIGDKSWKFTFTVVDRLDGEVYLGWDFCRKTGLTLLAGRGTYTFGNGEFPLCYSQHSREDAISSSRSGEPKVPVQHEHIV